MIFIALLSQSHSLFKCFINSFYLLQMCIKHWEFAFPKFAGYLHSPCINDDALFLPHSWDPELIYLPSFSSKWTTCLFLSEVHKHWQCVYSMTTKPVDNLSYLLMKNNYYIIFPNKHIVINIPTLPLYKHSIHHWLVTTRKTD